jgi:hypothetical protein
VASYSVFFGSTLIGHSDLEMHDASMGVAIGKFRPTPEYADLRSKCIAACLDRSQERQGLRVQTSDGEVLPAQGGVMLLDTERIPISEVEVEVAGIPSPFYEKVFS